MSNADAMYANGLDGGSTPVATSHRENQTPARQPIKAPTITAGTLDAMASFCRCQWLAPSAARMRSS